MCNWRKARREWELKLIIDEWKFGLMQCLHPKFQLNDIVKAKAVTHKEYDTTKHPKPKPKKDDTDELDEPDKTSIAATKPNKDTAKSNVVVKPPSKPAVKPTMKPAVKPPTKLAAKPPAKPAAKPPGKPPTKPTDELDKPDKTSAAATKPNKDTAKPNAAVKPPTELAVDNGDETGDKPGDETDDKPETGKVTPSTIIISDSDDDPVDLTFSNDDLNNNDDINEAEMAAIDKATAPHKKTFANSDDEGFQFGNPFYDEQWTK
ncbi:hypothetical protein N7513_001336 [Penicillium frequentans]|nr:hypothetical protein N7513_001336 [Penicillium glabrum]